LPEKISSRVETPGLLIETGFKTGRAVNRCPLHPGYALVCLQMGRCQRGRDRDGWLDQEPALVLLRRVAHDAV